MGLSDLGSNLPTVSTGIDAAGGTSGATGSGSTAGGLVNPETPPKPGSPSDIPGLAPSAPGLGPGTGSPLNPPGDSASQWSRTGTGKSKSRSEADKAREEAMNANRAAAAAIDEPPSGPPARSFSSGGLQGFSKKELEYMEKYPVRMNGRSRLPENMDLNRFEDRFKLAQGREISGHDYKRMFGRILAKPRNDFRYLEKEQTRYDDRVDGKNPTFDSYRQDKPINLTDPLGGR